MIAKNVLVLYKRSTLKIYFLDPKSALFGQQNRLNLRGRKTFQMAHEEHYKTLNEIEKILSARGINYQKYCRGTKVDYAKFDFVITVGGDGTFLEAARQVRSQIIMGVNSDPERSIGRFCCVHRRNFEKVLTSVLTGRRHPRILTRLRLEVSCQKKGIDFSNDILICQKNPAAMSRYVLNVNGIQEEQRSSGLWIATAPGSSGGIHSAGGKLLDFFDKKAQFLARELHSVKGVHYQLKKGILSLKTPLMIESIMRNGMIYIDGPHLRVPFRFGDLAKITLSKNKLRIIYP